MVTGYLGDARMDDENEAKKPTDHDIGMVLDALSIDELDARIALLRQEIVRLEAAIEKKTASKSAAESFFKS